MSESPLSGITVKITPPTGWNTASFRAMLGILREDVGSHAGGVLVPAAQMLMVHRFGEWAAAQRWPLGKACLLIFRILNVYIRNVLGFEVSHLTKIGRRVVFLHQNGVVIQPDAEIGDECMIYHNVTIGRRWDDGRPGSFREPVKVGRGVHLGVGCTIIGAVQIGDGAKIGPNALVVTSVPPGASVVAPASRILRLR